MLGTCPSLGAFLLPFCGMPSCLRFSSVSPYPPAGVLCVPQLSQVSPNILLHACWEACDWHLCNSGGSPLKKKKKKKQKNYRPQDYPPPDYRPLDYRPLSVAGDHTLRILLDPADRARPYGSSWTLRIELGPTERATGRGQSTDRTCRQVRPSRCRPSDQLGRHRLSAL